MHDERSTEANTTHNNSRILDLSTNQTMEMVRMERWQPGSPFTGVMRFIECQFNCGDCGIACARDKPLGRISNVCCGARERSSGQARDGQQRAATKDPASKTSQLRLAFPLWVP